MKLFLQLTNCLGLEKRGRKAKVLHCRGFWDGQRSAFFDISVCHPNADSYRDLSPKQIYRIHENEKNRNYNSRVTEIEQGTFTPLVFTTTGGMADECLRYHSRLAELLSAIKGLFEATTILHDEIHASV